MAKYSIQPVTTGSFAEAETSLLYYLADDRNAGVKIPAVYWMFLIRGEGEIILVDTGPGEHAAWKRLHHDYDRTPDQEPVAALQRLGIVLGDIDVVINTHLHWDHCHGNHFFSNAVIRVQHARSSKQCIHFRLTAASTRPLRLTHRGCAPSRRPGR